MANPKRKNSGRRPHHHAQRACGESSERVERRAIICLGPGGVGKTTCAAAIALQTAQNGRRTLVCTLDPARRLATSLGLSALPETPRALPAVHLENAGLPRDLPLQAMRMDVEAAFQRTLDRECPDTRLAQSIRKNRLFRQLIGDLDGVQAYAAIAQLLELEESTDWDVLVLDTPPTRHFKNLLTAPDKILGALRSPFYRFLLAPGWTAKAGLSLARFSHNRLVQRIAKIVGVEFLAQMSELIGLMGALNEQIGARARQADRFFRSRQVGYVVISSPTLGRCEEALELACELKNSGMQVIAAVLNRVHPVPPPGWTRPSHKELCALLRKNPLLKNLSEDVCRKLAAHLLRIHRTYMALAENEHTGIHMMENKLAARVDVLKIPLLEDDPSDLENLRRLGRWIKLDFGMHRFLGNGKDSHGL
jgi:anion-transporting  ArsA/GET3 family ATPase